uniref:Si:dkey-14o18.2 n=1 Tax=Oryzias latipes TaxID=8090 RepID=A0A3P9IEA3_ORYLA
MTRDSHPPSLKLSRVLHHQWIGFSLGFVLPVFPLCPLLLCYFLSCAAGAGSLPGIEYSYGISPKFVCTPVPPEADPSCYSPPTVPHGPSGSSHDHGGGTHRSMMSDEAKATILHLRESLVRQKETILDQRETIRELTAKLTLCEGFGSHHSVGHHENHHESHHDPHHDTHHSGHHEDHHGRHGSHSGPSSLHHSPSAHDHHPSHGSHRPDLHHRKGSSHSKHSSFSPEQTGKTLQTLKERLENLQARNSSSSYSSSLRQLLQRKINALEEQLHRFHRDPHSDPHRDHHDDHHEHNHGGSHYDDHRDDHHDTHHGTGHHEDLHGLGHHEDHHSSHHSDHSSHHTDHGYHKPNNHHNNHHYDHSYDWHHGRHYGHYGNHPSSHHEDHTNDHHAGDHHDDHHDYYHEHGRNGDHHDDHHDNHHETSHYDQYHQPQHLPYSSKETSPQGPGHSKLETVLGQLHPSGGHGNKPKLKSPSAFLLDFPMRTNYMYAKMKRSLVNEIFAMTLCLWLKSGESSGLGTPISYAIPGQANELVLIEWSNNPMELLINDKAATMPITVTDGKWHHVCVTWSTRDGAWEAYQDGVKKGSGQNLSAWQSIKPGGIFILGQEQDTMGGRFDITQSFMGEMSDLQFWSRVLTADEIHIQATCGGHLVGDVMSWSEELVELHGGLNELPYEPCH